MKVTEGRYRIIEDKTGNTLKIDPALQRDAGKNHIYSLFFSNLSPSFKSNYISG